MVVQPRLDVPPEILEGLASGVYKRFGGIVRHATQGYIVKHLAEAPNEAIEQAAGATRSVVVRIPPALKNPWVIGGTLLGTAVATIATVAIVRSKKKRAAEEQELIEMQGDLTRYSVALRQYLEAARSGSLSELVIAHLIDALDEAASGGSIDFENEESGQLVSLLVGYTRILAEANSIRLEELLEPLEESNQAGDLRRHLVAQLSIFSATE